MLSLTLVVETFSGVIAPNQTATEKPYTELSVTVPSEVTKSLETSRKPVVVNIKGENGHPALADKPNNSAPMVETIVVKLPANIKAEDDNKTQVKITGPGKTHIKASVHHGTTFLEIPEGKERRTQWGVLSGNVLQGLSWYPNTAIISLSQIKISILLLNFRHTHLVSRHADWRSDGLNALRVMSPDGCAYGTCEFNRLSGCVCLLI